MILTAILGPIQWSDIRIPMAVVVISLGNMDQQCSIMDVQPRENTDSVERLDK